MCVIIVKNKGVEMPSKKELKLAFEHNPHGWGIVSSNGVFAHGMDFQTFLSILKGVSTEDACIIHFRIATHGSVGVKNCHPFKGEYFMKFKDGSDAVSRSTSPTTASSPSVLSEI